MTVATAIQSDFKIQEHLASATLEPLSKETEQVTAPLNLRQNDFLEIDVDADLKRFIVQAISLRPIAVPDPIPGWDAVNMAEAEQQEDRGDYVINGVPYVKEGWPSREATHYWINRVPERRESGSGRWILAATDYTMLVVLNSWPSDRIIFKSQEAQVQMTYLLRRFLVQKRAQRVIANFKVEGTCPDMPDDFIDHPERPAADYQKAAMLASLNQPAFGFFGEQGTGKTLMAILRINLEASRKRAGKVAGVKAGMYRALILCPKQVRSNWHNEFERFSTSPGKVGVMRGGLIDRQKVLLDCVKDEEDCDWSACILSMDSSAQSMEMLKRVPWDIVVVDESHYMKNPSSKRFKTLREFNNTSTRQKLILTGTPIANSLFDLWAQFEFLGEGMSGFSTRENFRKFHGQFASNNSQASPVQKLVGLKGIPMIQERLARMAFLIRKDEALTNLPPKVYDIEEVEMTALQKEYYEKMADMIAIELEAELADPKVMTVNHILTRLLRLAQITSGHVKWDGDIDENTGEPIVGKVEQIAGGNPKADAIVKMLQDEGRDPNEKTIVWCTFVEDMRVVSEALTAAGIKHIGYHPTLQSNVRARNPEDAADRFNKDASIQVFIGNPQSGGTGLNIVGYDYTLPEEEQGQTYTGHEIFMSCNWSAVQRSQAEDRAHRRGTKRSVRITDLMVLGTIDEEIRARVLSKRQSAMEIQDVRDILTKVLEGYRNR
ncbi:MAG: hypothetical protein CMF17_11790 [Idiomarinaceae bacterium]|nr:hypothetical protein [Idiomarinaceae bacterium]